MSEKKQTAVEWLALELYKKMQMKGDGNIFDDILNQALQMEREQIEEAFKVGRIPALFSINKSAKQKALEMVEKFDREIWLSDLNVLPDMNLSLDEETFELAKQCALIDINHQIELLAEINNNESFNVSSYANFLIEVRAEIEKF